MFFSFSLLIAWNLKHFPVVVFFSFVACIVLPWAQRVSSGLFVCHILPVPTGIVIDITISYTLFLVVFNFGSVCFGMD